MATQLIDLTPTAYSEIPTGGHLIQFRELVVYQPFNAVILTPTEPRYVICMVMVGETGLPECTIEKERPLTPEETAHFTRLVKAAERDAKRAQHQQQRHELAQSHGALPTFETPGGRVRL